MEGSVCMHVRLKVTVGAFYVYLNICLTNVIYRNTNNFFCYLYSNYSSLNTRFKILDFYVKAMFFFFGLCYYIFICLKWPTMKIQTFCTVAFCYNRFTPTSFEVIYKNIYSLVYTLYFFNVNKES